MGDLLSTNNWASGPFNEKKPFGNASVIKGDNIGKSMDRYRAFNAARAGTATPEQRILLEECDRLINDVIDRRDGE